MTHPVDKIDHDHDKALFNPHGVGTVLLRSRLQPGQCKVLVPSGGVWVEGDSGECPSSRQQQQQYSLHSPHPDTALAVIFPARPHTCSVKESFMSYSGD